MRARPDLIGRMIVGVDWETETQFGIQPSPNEILALIFSDGTSAVFGGSDQIGVNAVWVDTVNDVGSPSAIDVVELLREMLRVDFLALEDWQRRAGALIHQIDEARAKAAAQTEGD